MYKKLLSTLMTQLLRKKIAMENINDNQKLVQINKDEDIKLIVIQALESSEIHFSFQTLITSIKNRILEFENSYPRRELTINELDIINKTIWDHIWERKLIIDFTDKRLYQNPEIFQFTKVINLK